MKGCPEFATQDLFIKADSMLLLPNKTEDDETIKADGRKLLKEWK